MSCQRSNDFSSLDDTWTAKSSLNRGQWMPYSFECGSKNTKENYCGSCGDNTNSVASQMWTQAGNVSPKDKLMNSIVVKGVNDSYKIRSSENYMNNTDNGDYLDIGKTWSVQKRYTS